MIKYFFFQGKSTHFYINVCSTVTPIEVSLQKPVQKTGLCSQMDGYNMYKIELNY